MGFHWSLSDNKSPQVSMTFLSIQADLKNVVVKMVLARPSISNSSCPLSKHLVTTASALIIIGIIVTFMLPSFFNC